MTKDERERLIRLEEAVKHILDAQESMAADVKELKTAFIKAGGVKWTLATMGLLVGWGIAQYKIVLEMVKS